MEHLLFTIQHSLDATLSYLFDVADKLHYTRILGASIVVGFVVFVIGMVLGMVDKEREIRKRKKKEELYRKAGVKTVWNGKYIAFSINEKKGGKV